MIKVSVLLEPDEAKRFDDYCRDRGFKKSTLAARLIRDHLDHEGYASQPGLFSIGERARTAEEPNNKGGR
jgi:hypothetical protein